MAAVIAVPFVLKDATFQVGTDNYESNVSTVKFTPSVTTVTWQPITPANPFQDSSAPVWSCEISYAQDWKTANSLSQYLLTNQGTQKVVVFKPQGVTTGSPIWTATLIIVPGDIGGDVSTVQVGTVTCGVVGVPVKTTAP